MAMDRRWSFSILQTGAKPPTGEPASMPAGRPAASGNRFPAITIAIAWSTRLTTSHGAPASAAPSSPKPVPTETAMAWSTRRIMLRGAANQGSMAMASGAVLQQLASVESVAPDHGPQGRVTSATADLVFALPELARPEEAGFPKRPLFRLLTDSAELEEQQLLAALTSRSRLSSRSNGPLPAVDRPTMELSATQETFGAFEDDDATDALDRALELLTAN